MYLDDIFDLLVLIFILGISVLVGFGIVMPMVRDDYLKMDKVLEDKTAPIIGYETTKLEKGLTKLEVVLMSQIQELGMPAPKKYKVGNTEFEVGGSYQDAENLTYIGVAVNGELNSIGGDKYEVVYNVNNTPLDKSDDYYEIRELVE